MPMIRSPGPSLTHDAGLQHFWLSLITFLLACEVDILLAFFLVNLKSVDGGQRAHITWAAIFTDFATGPLVDMSGCTDLTFLDTLHIHAKSPDQMPESPSLLQSAVLAMHIV